MVRSLKEGKIVELSGVDILADGIAIKRPSDLTFDVTRELVDDIVVVDGDEIAHAILRAL